MEINKTILSTLQEKIAKISKQISQLARESLKSKYMYMFDHDNIFL